MALDSSHGTLSPAIWLICITPILPHARVAPLGTDVTVLAWLSRVYSRPDKAPGGSPAPGMQEHGLIQAVLWEVSSQALAAAVRSPFYLESCGAGTLPCTPVPWAALPRLSKPQGRANTHGSPRGESSVGIEAHSWDMPSPATTIVGAQGGGAAGRTLVGLTAVAGVCLPGQEERAEEGVSASRCLG